METLQFFLFGQFKIVGNNQHSLVLEPRRAQELLAYLLLYHDHRHTREKLATLWWGDKPAAQAKRYLRQTLWQVQSSFNALTADPTRVLWTDHERIGLDGQAAYWLDTAVFEEAFAAVNQLPGCELTVQQVELLRRALPLYQGDLLEGWYQDWCVYERERYQNMYLTMLDKLLAYSTAHHFYDAGVAYGEQILRYDHAREQTHRQLMHLHYQAGNRSAAMHQYDACVTALRKELEVEPAPSTVALYRQICREPSNDLLKPPAGERQPCFPRNGQSVTLPLRAQSNIATIQSPKAQVDEMVEELEHIQLALGQLQAQVAHLLQGLAHRSQLQA